MTKTFNRWETCEVCEGYGMQIRDVSRGSVIPPDKPCVCNGTGLQRKENIKLTQYKN